MLLSGSWEADQAKALHKLTCSVTDFYTALAVLMRSAHGIHTCCCVLLLSRHPPVEGHRVCGRKLENNKTEQLDYTGEYEHNV